MKRAREDQVAAGIPGSWLSRSGWRASNAQFVLPTTPSSGFCRASSLPCRISWKSFGQSLLP
eukprot:55162-Lingulodinium_polyedra.AAC.1